MNGITVDPEMKSRVMSAVSAAIREQSGTGSSGTEVKGPQVRRPEVRTPEVRKTEAGKPEVRTTGARKPEVRTSEVRKPEVRTPETRESGVRRPETDRSSSGKAEVTHIESRKKAKKIPVALITSIAAGILVVAGILFFLGRYLGMSKSAMSEIRTHNVAAETTAAGIRNYAAETVADAAEYYEETTTRPAEDTAAAERGGEENESEDDSNYTNGLNNKNSLTVDITVETGSIAAGIKDDESEGTGDKRLDGIAEALPFDIMGSGSGEFSEGITKEVFFGVNGEKVLLVTADGEADLVKTVFSVNSDEYVEGTTPAGMPVKFYRIAFIDVPELGRDETSSDLNAAVFTRDGKTYLLVFSNIQPPEVIGRVADAV